MDLDWIKDYCMYNIDKDTMSIYMFDNDSYEQVYITFKFIYENRETEAQSNSQLDSVVINNAIYKLYKSEKKYLEFIRELDFKQLHWLPPYEFDYVFRERIKMYETDYLYVDIEYQRENSEVNVDYWRTRFYGGPI